MGAVYLSSDMRLAENMVAVKENLITNQAGAEQFQTEANLLARLNHPNLPRVSDHFLEQGHQYLVMDFIDGEDLQHMVHRTGALSESQALIWMRQVFDAVAYLHANRVIHRDIKPANIRITPQGKAILVDFGIAKLQVYGQRTQSTAHAATAGYSPPEQYSGSTGSYSDVYSLGATLYFILTGKTPVEAPLRSAGIELPSPRMLNTGISAYTEQVILCAMNPSAASRFRNAPQMGRALFAARFQTPNAGFKTLSPITVERRKSGSVLLLGAVATLIFIILVALLRAGGSGTSSPALILTTSASATKAIVDKQVTELTLIAPNATSFNVLPPTAKPPTATATRPTIPFGNFTFGRDGKSSSGCKVLHETTLISQVELAEDEWLYFVTPFESPDIGRTLLWSVYGPDGRTLFDDEPRQLSTTLSLCLWQGFALARDTKPGNYVLQVTLNDAVAFKKEFTIKFSDPSAFPTKPARDALGAFTFGREGVTTKSCKVTDPLTLVSQGALKRDGYFYFASSYVVDEIGRSLYWTVYRPNETILMGPTERTLKDSNDLCFWQGFSLSEDVPLGKYRLDVEFHSRVVFRVTFQIQSDRPITNVTAIPSPTQPPR